jgi:hypothetical protein
MNIGAPMTGKVSRPCITAGMGMGERSRDFPPISVAQPASAL